jgi:hypothetical protein
MANKRLYKVQRLKIGSTAFGGLQSVNLLPAYAQQVLSSPDGAFGPEDVDGVGLGFAFNLATTDVTKAAGILVTNESADQDWQYAHAESGTSTWYTTVIKDSLITSMNLSFPFAGDAVLTIGGELLASETASVADTLDAMQDLTAAVNSTALGVAGFAQTYPTRLFKPNTLSFANYTALTAVGAAITPLHCESVNLSGTANLLRDTSDTNIGFAAMDIESWNALAVSMTFRDATTTASKQLAAQLIAEGQGRLTFNCHGRNQGAATDHTATVEGVKWLGWSENDGPDYKTYTVNGVASWRRVVGTNTAIAWSSTPPMLAIT